MTNPSALSRIINHQTLLHLLPSDDPSNPGYTWQWRGKKGEVFASEALALADAINCLNDSYQEAMIMYSRLNSLHSSQEVTSLCAEIEAMSEKKSSSVEESADNEEALGGMFLFWIVFTSLILGVLAYLLR